MAAPPLNRSGTPVPIGFDVEGSHDRLSSANGAYFYNHATLDSTLATEQDAIELKGVDRTIGIVLDEERQSAVILLHALCRVEFNVDRRVGGGDGYS
jgi:hypothetical protein